jgi:hypothetical protein
LGTVSAARYNKMPSIIEPDQRRIRRHTGSLDHPNTLSNDTRNGFNFFKEERFAAKVPAEPLEPFPEANSP